MSKMMLDFLVEYNYVDAEKDDINFIKELIKPETYVQCMSAS